MRKESSRRSSLLLMEIILSILFFAFSSAVCLQTFVRANLLGKEAKELDMAVRCVSSAAELLSRPEHTMEHLRKLYPDALIEERDVCVWFDSDFLPCSSKEAFYQMEITSYTQDEHTTTWSVALSGSDQDEIYRLDGTTYQPYTLQDEL